MTFLDPIFALKMFDIGIYADKAGYIYLSLLASYAFFGFMGGPLEKIASVRNLITSGYLLGFVGFGLIAHYLYFGVNLLPLIIVGLFINGYSVIAGNTFATIYTKSQLMDEGEACGISRKKVGGYFGGVKGSMNLFGTFVGPLVSTNIYLLIGFEYSCLIMGAIQVIFALFFYVVTHYQEKNKALLHNKEDYRKFVDQDDEIEYLHKGKKLNKTTD